MALNYAQKGNRFDLCKRDLLGAAPGVCLEVAKSWELMILSASWERALILIPGTQE